MSSLRRMRSFSRCTDEAKAQAKAAGLEVFGLEWLKTMPYQKPAADSYGTQGVLANDLWIRLATINDVSEKALDQTNAASVSYDQPMGMGAAAAGTTVAGGVPRAPHAVLLPVGRQVGRQVGR